MPEFGVRHGVAALPAPGPAPREHRFTSCDPATRTCCWVTALDLATVCESLGHSSVCTTAGIISQITRAVAGLTLPHRKLTLISAPGWWRCGRYDPGRLACKAVSHGLRLLADNETVGWIIGRVNIINHALREISC